MTLLCLTLLDFSVRQNLQNSHLISSVKSLSVKDWNAVPSTPTSALSLASFKMALSDYLRHLVFALNCFKDFISSFLLFVAINHRMEINLNITEHVSFIRHDRQSV